MHRVVCRQAELAAAAEGAAAPEKSDEKENAAAPEESDEELAQKRMSQWVKSGEDDIEGEKVADEAVEGAEEMAGEDNEVGSTPLGTCQIRGIKEGQRIQVGCYHVTPASHALLRACLGPVMRLLRFDHTT